MSTFADAYSRYLSNNFNYTNKYKTFRKYFRNSIISITDPNFMSKALIDNKDSFPKYPYFFNVFARTDSINLVKIYNSTMDNTGNLMESMVGSSELAKKEFYDTVPSSLDSFLSEINFQFAYTSTPIDLYNYELIIKSFVNEYQYRNFFSDLYAPLFYSVDQIEGQTAGLESNSFLYEYILYCTLYNTMTISHNIYPKMLLYLTYINSEANPIDRVDQQAMLTGFSTFVTSYADTITTDLAVVIGKSMYDFQNVSKTMLKYLTEIISVELCDSVNGLNRAFYNFYNPVKSLGPINFLVNNITQQLNALVAADLVTKIYTNINIIDQNIMDNRTIEEDNIYSGFMEKLSESELKNYLFLCFLYKFWPIKFLNILQLSIKEYVETLIKSSNDNVMTQANYTTIFENFVNKDNTNINYTNLKIFLDGYISPLASIVVDEYGNNAKFTFTTGSTFITCSDIDSYNAVNIHDYIYADGESYEVGGDNKKYSAHVVSKVIGTLTLVIDNEYTGLISGTAVNAYRYSFSPTNYLYNALSTSYVTEFSCITYYIYVLEEFFKSTTYNNFVENLTEKIFTQLRDSGHIDYTFDWYQYHDIIDIYFKVFLRWKLLDTSKRCTLSTHVNAHYSFTKDLEYVYCANIDSYNLIADNTFIFSGQDTIDNAVQVIGHQIVGNKYVLNLNSHYLGTTTDVGTNDVAYSFLSTDSLLFDNVTKNLTGKLLPLFLTNSSLVPEYDINTSIPSVEDLQNYFKSYSNSNSFARSMNQFNENMMTSTVTREIIYSVLSEFV